MATRTTTARKLTFAAGALYILTFLASIPTLAMKAPVTDHADFILGVGNENSVIAASLLDLVCALAGIGTAVALYPVLRKFREHLALGFVTSRVVEAGVLFVGAISLMSIVTLRSDSGAADSATLVTTGKSLLAMHDWAFLFGPGVMAVVNALMFATILYRFRLVPRIIPLVGLIGAPLLLTSDLVTMFGGWEQTSDPAMLLVLPIAAWEFTIGIWMMVKGFRPVATADVETPVAQPAFAA